MSFCKNHKLRFFRQKTLNKRFVLALIAIALCLSISAQENLERQIRQLFAYIENSPRQEVDHAIRQLIEIGPQVLPFAKERLKETGNPDYLYIIQEVSRTSQTSGQQTWNKKKYFLQHYQKALGLLETGSPEKAIEISEAILTLEPGTHLKQQLQQLIRKARTAKFSQQILRGGIFTAHKYYTYGKKIEITLVLHNRSANPLVMETAGKKIILQIATKDFDLASHAHFRTQTRFLTLPQSVSIANNAKWTATFHIDNPPPFVQGYREIQISTKIPLVSVIHGDKREHPNITFPNIQIPVLPSPYHSIVAQPLRNFRGALKFSSAPTLFYTSFFIPQHRQSKIISLLIAQLEDSDERMKTVILGILRRYTTKNFTSVKRWRNWWAANKELSREE